MNIAFIFSSIILFQYTLANCGSAFVQIPGAENLFDIDVYCGGVFGNPSWDSANAAPIIAIATIDGNPGGVVSSK